MQPAARYAAAIEILDAILAGGASAQVLANWARRNRFAGSKDRAAIRDIVFEAERNRASAGWLGGSLSGRGIIIGLLRIQTVDPATIFTGEGYAPAPLEEREKNAKDLADAPVAVRADLPEWILPEVRNATGDAFEDVCLILKSRAPVFLRVNTRKTTPAQAAEKLREDGIETKPARISPIGLEVIANARKVATSTAYLSGLVELQDAASQAAMGLLEPARFSTILDYCAGGGGKALALADLSDAKIFAHDVDPARMADIAPRAARAGVSIRELRGEALKAQAPFDLVLVDAPCSGSGTWRRNPSAKWDFQRSDLAALLAVQSQILSEAARLVAPGGTLAYATCSVLMQENTNQITDFTKAHPEWQCDLSRSFLPGPEGDGFFISLLTRTNI